MITSLCSLKRYLSAVNKAAEFIKEREGIFRLKLPFKTVYTSVFLIIDGETKMLMDSASYPSDVDGYIVPALIKLGYELSDIKYLVLSHNHSDHRGGLERLCELNPSLEVVREVRAITDSVSTYSLAGHTLDSIGILDERTHTLISADGLQGDGVDKFRCSLESEAEYLKTIEKIRQDKRIECVLFSHAYEPWFKDSVLSRAELEECLTYMKGKRYESNTCK